MYRKTIIMYSNVSSYRTEVADIAFARQEWACKDARNIIEGKMVDSNV
jgi:hypothetical protein